MEAEGRWVMLTEELDQALVSGLAMLDTHILLAATAGKGLFQYDVRTAQPAKRKGSSSDLVDPKERLSHRYFRVVAVNRHQHIYLGAQDGGIFRSTDHGASWSSMSRTLPNDSIRSIVSHSSGLFVGTGRGVYTMTSNDGKWKSINTGLTELSIQTLIMTTQGVLYAGTSAGVFRSDNGGGQWVDVSEGMGKHTERPHPYR
jgi:ligand-binding sensor domain-containing protein